jgi:hypothetical protein
MPAPIDRKRLPYHTDKITRFERSDMIHSYTRAEAIADGVLIDVSETAKEAGFRYLRRTASPRSRLMDFRRSRRRRTDQ